MNLLKQFTLSDFPSGYTVSPGSIAVAPKNIYIPVTSQAQQKGRLLVYDYDGMRQNDKEFDLDYTSGISYGGATYYNGQVWVVSDEQIDERFAGCIEIYDPIQKVKVSNIGLDWLTGHEEFQCLGITVEQNKIYVLSKRTGWVNRQQVSEKYLVEHYTPEGDWIGYSDLNSNNPEPIGLADDENELFVCDVPGNKAYSYKAKEQKNDFLSDGTKDFNLDPGNIKCHGIGYNGIAFIVLRYYDLNNQVSPAIFIYGDTDIMPPFDPDGHSSSVTTGIYKQFESLCDEFDRKFSVLSKGSSIPKEWNIEGKTEQDIQMYFKTSADFLTASNLESRAFGSLVYFDFIPQYTLPGLIEGDVIVDADQDSSAKSRYEIVGFYESGNGNYQKIIARKVG